MTDNDSIVYPDENDILRLRKSFKLVADGYLSKSELAYILDAVKDIYNERKSADLLATKAAFILFKIISSHPLLMVTRELRMERLTFS